MPILWAAYMSTSICTQEAQAPTESVHYRVCLTGAHKCVLPTSLVPKVGGLVELPRQEGVPTAPAGRVTGSSLMERVPPGCSRPASIMRKASSPQAENVAVVATW